MTREEAYNTLMRMRAWRKWGRGEQNEEDRPPIVSQKEVDEALDVFIETIKTHIFPKGLDEAAEDYKQGVIDTGSDYLSESGESLYYAEALKEAYKSGAVWAFGQGETKEQEVFEADPQGILSVPMVLSSVDTFDVGDKVIVQIRKK